MPKETLCVVLVLIVVVAIILFMGLPKLLYTREEVRNAYLKLDDVLKARWSVIPKFIEAIKPYVGGDSKTFEEIILLRNTTFENMSFSKKLETDKELNNRIVNLCLNNKEYANIQKDERFQNVMVSLEKLGNELMTAKNDYNDSVDKLNKLITKFPSNIVAIIAGFKKVDKI